jgi:phage-related holin
VEEAINDSLLNALEAHGLQKLEGKEGNADVVQKVRNIFAVRLQQTVDRLVPYSPHGR